jgi:hypothetical protein
MRIEIKVLRGGGPIEKKDGILTVFTTEKRKNNRANIDVVKQLSKYYSVPQASIRIVAGATSTKKVVEIENI